ncbi:hypothetical protein MUP95_01135, partial [bacterium]|nr:hypothetical protein [bacterium]
MLKKNILIVFFIVLSAGILYVFLPSFSVKTLEVTNPYDETVFPSDIASPTFRWVDNLSGAKNWTLRIEFQDPDEKPLEFQTSSMEWTPNKELWESIKERSLEKTVKFTIFGYKKILGIKKIRSKKTISMKTSRDEVGAPILFRGVPLPFEFAVENMDAIKWYLGDISSEARPRVVLEDLMMCGNCHSFSSEGKVLGMDVDYASDKGSYVITGVSEDMKLTKDKIITWSDYKREDQELTFGLLSQVSPNGKYVVSTVKDRSVFVPKPDLYYSQLFFPLKGILTYYNVETASFHALSGADDRKYVQSNPAWSPDGKDIVFARSEADLTVGGGTGGRALLTDEECKVYLTEGKIFRYDLYKIPFNAGKGGKAESLEGASDNSMSNYF